MCTYGAPGWVLDAKLHSYMQGKFTKMLKYAQGWCVTEHIALVDIYKYVDSIKSIVVKQRMAMLGNVFRSEKAAPQVMCRVLSFLGAQSVSSTSPPSLIRQLIEDYNCAAGTNVTSFATVKLAMLDVKKWTTLTEAARKWHAAALEPVGGGNRRKTRPRAGELPEVPPATPISDVESRRRQPKQSRPVRRSPIKNRGGGSVSSNPLSPREAAQEQLFYGLQRQNTEERRQANAAGSGARRRGTPGVNSTRRAVASQARDARHRDGDDTSQTSTSRSRHDLVTDFVSDTDSLMSSINGETRNS